ncbi:TRAG family protein (plasmid) [Prosthecochloris aestuarii DSM 271]|uniref:TRAG family protein n=1 Tax=Prosthecochloris aestuarii (strain DSM 271 / SK 413) TaxID=290512 RepID=B4S9K8_PROA2|nr:conjugal transfer protein TraG [Prosthecochloris aestuarii]ACF47335.1 TRAG family protein [Prosthecochloris aestuarii DSM 271]
MKQKRAVHVFYGHVATGLLFMLLGTWAATQYVAFLLGYQPQLGEPLMIIGGYPVYEPWAWMFWSYHFEPYAPHVFEYASRITYASFFAMAGVMVVLSILRAKRQRQAGTYGTARWATEKELDEAGILAEEGIVLAQTRDARYASAVSRHNGEAEVKWVMKKPGAAILRHNGPEHVFCFAPTRSGKGVGLVIPTLLAWKGSCVVYDIKKENWAATAGWRRQFSHCWCFEPTSPHSVRFNPLMEIRQGDNEVRDVQNVADILVDPEGVKDRLDHWEKTGHALLVGAILHVLYAEEDKTLSGVAGFLANPGRSIEETLGMMLSHHHLEGHPHPVVASCAREMLNKSENELSGVLSTAMSFLGLYRDPVIARSTAVSDFRISDLMQGDRPVSLYLVVPPSDIDRTKPLIRLMLNQMGRRLTEKIGFGKKHYRHRLLMMLDEFPSLGRLGFYETELAYMAGYGIKCIMIAQSLNQIEKVYGQNNAILDNSHVRITYGALDERTAKRISDLLGQATEKRQQLNYAGNRLAPWLGHVMQSEQESPRPLLTPGEILQLPGDDALVMIGGLPPYRAKKLMYYQDRRFEGMAWRPAPDTPEEQQKELPEHVAPPAWMDYASERNETRYDTSYIDASGCSCGEGSGPGMSAHDDDESEEHQDLQHDHEQEHVLERMHPEDELYEGIIPEHAEDDEASVPGHQQPADESERRSRRQDRNRTIELSRTPGGGDLPL